MTNQEPPVVLKFNPDPDEPELIEFYSTLGMCVSSWAFVDRRLYEIFHYVLKMDSRQSALLYYRLKAFNQRLRLVDDALRSFLTKKAYTDEWGPVQARLVDLSHTRNIIAHHPTKRVGKRKDGRPIYIYTIYIEPYERILNNDYKGLRGKDELGVEDLKEHDREIEKMEVDLRWVLYYITTYLQGGK
jgi:hypothetical protein